MTVFCRHFNPRSLVRDSFHFSESLDDSSALFGFSQTTLFFNLRTGRILADSTGEVLGTQSLLKGLPLAAFDSRCGGVGTYYASFEATAKLEFRVDSARASGAQPFILY